jgi:Domain of unknown function (DUF4160)
VKNFVVFLNELSFTFDDTMEPEAMLPPVLSTLAAVRAAKKVRNDITIVGHVTLAGVLFNGGTYSLASVLRSDAHKEEWRFLRGLDQASPWETYSDSRAPGELQELVFQGRAAVGMLWATQNGSAVVSFALSRDWGYSSVQAELLEMDMAGNITSANVQVPNLSNPEHVATHRDLISTYGATLSSSSLIYEGDGFVVRMFFRDHDPPHFHVLPRRDSSETLAKYAIDTLDLLSGSLSPALRKVVEEWAGNRKEELRNSWARCRAGQHPFSLGA